MFERNFNVKPAECAGYFWVLAILKIEKTTNNNR
jgi:hypothetical protein